MAANKGDQFRDDIAAFLRAVRKDVDVEVQTGHKRVDILWKKQDFGGKARTVAIECKNYARALSLEEVAVIWADYGALYEKQLIDEVLLITKLDISPTAKNYVNSVRALSYMTFSQLQDAVLNVQAYLRSLASSFTEEGTGNYYIASHCDSGVEAITFISEWIEAKARPTLAVLASYGMGKTTTARKIAAELADAHLQGMEVRIPIYVQLQEIVGEQSLEGLLGKVLAARAPIEGYHFDTFMTLNKAGRFLVILDGFDEMKHAMTWDDFRATFKELNRLVSPNSKVLLLGRPTAFLSDDEETFVLRGLRTLGERQIREPDWPNYETIKLLPFSAAQSIAFVRNYSKYRIENGVDDEYMVDDAEFTRRTEILENSDLGDLLSRPVQAKMFCEMFLDKFVDPKPYLTGELYEIFVRRIIEREIDKRTRSPFGYVDRRKFAEAIAWWLWTTAQTMSVEEGEIPEEIVRSFTSKTDTELDAVRRDLVSACFLERKGNKTLFFPHRSFQEFLVSSYITTNQIDDMNLVVTAATRDVCRFISEATESATTFKLWYHALLRFTGTMPLYLLKLVARSVSEQEIQRKQVQCPWDVALNFLISCKVDASSDDIHVRLISLNPIVSSQSFSADPEERSICLDVLLIALSYADPSIQSIISSNIFGVLLNQMRLHLGIMPGSGATPKFSPSRYLHASASDPYYQMLKNSFKLTNTERGEVEVKYSPHRLEAAVRERYPSFRISDLDGLERVPEQTIVIAAERSHPHVDKNRLSQALAVLGSTGFALITPREAMLPAMLIADRDIANGPHIEAKDLENVRLHSPLHFRLAFRSRDEASIDLDSLVVSYLRGPNVDLTPRIKPFVNLTGIEILQAEVPDGEHTLRIDLKDVDGRISTKTFILTVMPN